ncbi:MAG: hypothetical protein V1903_04625 [Bacteroidota bacterium]
MNKIGVISRSCGLLAAVASEQPLIIKEMTNLLQEIRSGKNY